MAEPEDVTRLLEQILETQREHLAEYRKVSQRFSEMQVEGLRLGQRHDRFYRQVVVVGGLVIGSLLVWLWSR